MKPTSKGPRKSGKSQIKGKRGQDRNFKAKNRKENTKSYKGPLQKTKSKQKQTRFPNKKLSLPSDQQRVGKEDNPVLKKAFVSKKGHKSDPKLDTLKSKEDGKKSKGHQKKDELITRMMGIYETLRRCDVVKKEKEKLIDEVLSLSTGKQNQIAYKHNSVRVLEMCVKYGNKEQRGKVWEVFSDLFEDIMKSKYGRFLIQKMLKYGTKKQRETLIKSVKGKVIALLKHKDAGRILEDVYAQYANPAQKRLMVEEFYGPEFFILKASFGSDLKEVLNAAPDRKRYVLSFLKDTLERLASKEVVTYSLYHRAAAEYLDNAEKVAREEFLQIMKEKVVNILHTEDGAKISMQCLWTGNAKNRKGITKSFKTYVTKICKEPHGHTVLMSLFDVIDDTLLVEKTVVSELVNNLSDLIVDQYGRRVILYLLAPRNTKYFSPPLIQRLSQGDDNENSKKTMDIRSAELKRGLFPALTSYFQTRIQEAMTDKHLCQILIELVRKSTGVFDCTAVLKGMAEVMSEDFDPIEHEEGHVISNPIGHWVLTCLLLHDKETVEQGHSPLLCQVITEQVPKRALKSWIQISRGAFIVARLVEVGASEVVSYVRSGLKSSMQSIDFESSKGLQALRKALKDAQ